MAAKSRRRTIAGKKVLVTAGPTREYWDPVRFLSNASSGAMGVALAREASDRGARVVLVVGPVDPGVLKKVLRPSVRVVPVISARDMERAVRGHLSGTEIFIGTAAVGDYRPAVAARQKIKKGAPRMSLRLVRNPDIIAGVARRGPKRPALVVGFALETQGLLANAQTKLRQKNLDWIVANREANMGRASGAAVLVSRGGERFAFGSMPKARLARKIWEALLPRLGRS